MIEAFRSTLEEAKYADIILHVVDASNPRAEKQMLVVYETLQNLGVTDKTIVTLFNKADKLERDAEVLRDHKADKTLYVSARRGIGLEELKDMLERILNERNILIERLYDFKDAGMIQLIRKHGRLLKEEYRPEGIYVRAYVPAEIYGAVTP